MSIALVSGRNALSSYLRVITSGKGSCALRPATIVTRRWPVTQIIDALEHPVGQGSELAISSQAARGRVAKGDIGEIRECFNRSGREPGQLTRLVPAWGQPAITENEAPVEAVDLHVGQRTESSSAATGRASTCAQAHAETPSPAGAECSRR